MGCTNLKEKILKEEVRIRNEQYRRKIMREIYEKFRYICFSIMPALIGAIFDTTVRGVDVQIRRPTRIGLERNMDTINGLIEVCGSKYVMRDKADYFEDLYQWS